jgi:hypothetical protein
MASKINEVITGTYDHKGEAIIYGDSVTGDTMIRTDQGLITIAQLFEKYAHDAVSQNGKEYVSGCAEKVVGFHAHDMVPEWNPIQMIMRHKTEKHLYEIHTQDHKCVTVTADHSMMVDRHGWLMEVTPPELEASDLLITLHVNDQGDLDVHHVHVAQVIHKGAHVDPVYDISIQHADPYFFGNDILLHNTDSAMFSSYNIMRKLEEFQDFSWRKEDVTALYDQIADVTNESFPEFMHTAFNVPESRCVIRAGREYVASKGMFITKKRYAALIYDKEGKRKDVNGKPGEIKAMGLDLKRSDTPKPVQDFLHEILVLVLTDGTKPQVFDRIKQFRTEFESWPAWTKGTPKRVNKLTYYGDLMRKQEGGMRDVWAQERKDAKKTIPGHVRASLNYNMLRDVYNDNTSLQITDGFKVTVCKLKDNPLGLTSVALPADQLIIPEWFKNLPFDDEAMAEALITKKVENLLGVLGWDLNEARNNETFDDLFSY